MVKYGSAYYVILNQGNWTNSNGQTVSGNYIPATGTFMAPYYNEYWRKATAKEIEAVTYDSNGNEQTGGTIDFPMFELNGSKGLMRLTQSEETSWFVDEKGVQTVGMEDGQRVEISPLEKKINIFDSSNKQVAQFDGDKVSSIDSLFGNSSGSLGGNDGFSGNHYESPPSGWHSGYVEGVESGMPVVEHELLTPENHYNEVVMTALRTCEGLAIEKLPPSYRDYCLQQAQPFLDSGLLTLQDQHLILSRDGLFVSDMVMTELMHVS